VKVVSNFTYLSKTGDGDPNYMF